MLKNLLFVLGKILVCMAGGSCAPITEHDPRVLAPAERGAPNADTIRALVPYRITFECTYSAN